MRHSLSSQVLLWISLFLFFNTPSVLSQELEVIPPTPNAMKMTEYYAQRPNLYTGTANVTIPLYTINFDGWQLPLTLSYNATGIRTNEEATEVGLGWALSATGVISRTIRGVDDLFEGGSSGLYTGYVYDNELINFDLGYEFDCNWIPQQNTLHWRLAQTRPDTEPDIFNYNFFGYSGSFVLSKKLSLTDTMEVVKITQDATSILFNEARKEFVIITPDGFKGIFPFKEKATSFSGSDTVAPQNLMNTCGENLIDVIELVNNSGKFQVVTSWYLGSITSPRNKIIEFDYYLAADSTCSYLSNSLAFAEREGYTITSPNCLQNVQEHVYLSSITIPDELSVRFLMEDRSDLRRNELFTPNSATQLFPLSGNLKRYSLIEVEGLHSESSLFKSITLQQSYFNQQYKESDFYSVNQATWLRSRLDKVVIDDKEYQFKYLTGASGVPNKLTFSIDHFGFGVANDWYDLLRPFVDSVNSCVLDDNDTKYYAQQWNRRIEFDHVQVGLLSRVLYPTKGYTEYEYEGHSYLPATDSIYLEEGGLKQSGGARIKTIKEFDFTGLKSKHRSFSYSLGSYNNPLGTSGKSATPLINGYG